jgi:phenylacetate-CoA ligase
MPLDDSLHRLVSSYSLAPQWIKNLAGGAYSLLPPAVRFGEAYSRYKSTFLAPDPVAAYATAKLQETLFAALTQVPAFLSHRYLLSGIAASPLEVLAQLPVTAKEDIKTSLSAYLSGAYPNAARLKMFTGGSTSVPMTFYLHRGISRAKEWAAFHAMGERFGTDGAGPILALRGRTVRSAGKGRIWTYEPIKRHLIVSSDHLEPGYMQEYVAALRHTPPAYVHAFPSALFPLIVWLRENHLEALLANVKCVLLTSESVFDHHMAAFQDFFACPVIVHYGHTERVLFANTLAGDSRYHFWPHYGNFELLDNLGRQITTPGQIGEIVGTSFDNLVMPFIRYRTGDYAVLSQTANPDFPGWPVVDRIEGRLQEFVVCRDRRLMTVTTLGAAHFAQLDQCLRIQYEQFEPGLLRLRVVPLRPLDRADLAQIARAVEAKMQGGCSVVVETVDSIEVTKRGKQRLLIQHLDISHYLGAAMSRETKFATTDAKAVVEPKPLTLSHGRSMLMVGTSSEMRGGIAAVVGSLIDGGLFRRLAARYVITHVEGTVSRKLVHFARAAIEVTRMLGSGGFAVIHAHVSSRGSFWRKSILLAVARCFGLKTIFHLHSGGFDRFANTGIGGPLLRWWIRRTLQSSSAVIVLSARWADWARGFAPGCPVEVVGNPVAVPHPRPDDSQRSGLGDAGGRVLYLGLICQPKGCWDLLDAWVEFRRLHPQWRLVVGGNGEVDRFLARSDELGIRNDIEYLGWVSGQAKENELRRADIFILPSYVEGMPVSVLEAMAWGAAVVCTPVGGVPDMMEAERHGLWVDAGRPDQINIALDRLATDFSLRRRLADGAYSHVLANNSVEAVNSHLLEIYRRIDQANGHFD